MLKFLITRYQFEKMKEIFESYDVEHIVWQEENLTGIGPNIDLKFDPKSTITVDITDVERW